MSLRLIREMHARLLHSGRGGTKDPGSAACKIGLVGRAPVTHSLYRHPSLKWLVAWMRSSASCMTTNRDYRR